MPPAITRKLRHAVSTLLGGTPPSEWDDARVETAYYRLSKRVRVDGEMNYRLVTRLLAIEHECRARDIDTTPIDNRVEAERRKQ